MSIRPRLCILALTVSACSGKDPVDSGVGVNQGPSIDHTPLSGAQTEGSLQLTATATDSDGVAEVVVYHRPEGVAFWDLTPMELDGDTWSVELDARAPGFDYYLRATDRFGAEGFLPAEADTGPWTVEVRPSAKTLPFSEDFELDAGQTNLYSLGWVTYSEGFANYVWQLSTNRSVSGAQSVFHGRGAVEADTMRDWLVSPPIDFTALSQVQVTWQESGAATADMGIHGLYVSTTGGDPTVHTFEPVEATLPAPTEDGFSRSAVIDLTAYTDAPLVWIAWLYEGDYGDDWYIDDVRVEALSADLTATYDGQAPEPVFPGETVTVDWTIVNGSAASAAGYEATLSLPNGGGTLNTPTQAVPDLDGYDSATLSWDIALDPDVPSDRYRAMQLEVTNGTNTWTIDDRFLIGYLSTATLDITLPEAAITQITLGVGDPSAPDTEVSVYSDFLDAGGASVVADLTPYADLLPPTAGVGRWFARVQTDRDGTVDAFTMSVSGLDYGGTESGGALTANQQSLFYVPRPPAPVIEDVLPESSEPGATAVPVQIVVGNNGADTQGPVTAELTTTDPDATITGGTGLTLDADVFTDGELRVIAGPTLDIAATHTDSSPVRLTLELTDGADSWSLPVDVAVPWPSLNSVGVAIDDSGGDEILDDGESASIEFTLSNVGALPTLGRADVTATLSASSTATATLDVATDRISALGTGDTDEIDLEVSSVSGSAGDDLVFDLLIDDGTRTYTTQASVTLGEPPWVALSAANDPVGDSVDPSGATFDFVSGRYRVYDGNIEIQLTSATEYDPATLYIESWGRTSGSPYTYYRFVVNAGVADYQGYTASGFTTLGTLTVDYLSSTEVQLTIPIEPLDTVTTALSLGFGTTWCGPPEYYCDHYPNSWGYPYDSFDPGLWFDLDW